MGGNRLANEGLKLMQETQTRLICKPRTFADASAWGKPGIRFPHACGKPGTPVPTVI
jgi:hypothetical protein